MKTIQVDMFAVGLGAAVLTQFAIDHDTTVTVLADGGVGTGHLPDSVLPKLRDALKSFRPDESPRLDLIVGTHYDGDHLKGLLPIVKDQGIDIGSVWLPPVSDPSEIPGPPEAADFLGHRLFDDEGHEIRNSYLLGKANVVEELHEWEKRVLHTLRDLSRRHEDESWLSLPDYHDLKSAPPSLSQIRENLDVQRRDFEDTSEERLLNSFRSFFESHELDARARTTRVSDSKIQDAMEETDNGSIHDVGIYDSRYGDVYDVALKSDSRWIYRWPWITDEENLSLLFKKRPTQARIIPTALATIRKSEARGGITAIHLAEIVEALRRRSPPIRPHSHLVEYNRPLRFAWSRSKREFEARGQGGETDLVLNLLGPSEQLVQKHSAKLPIGMYLAALTSQDLIRRESITPSNQLSYIFTLEMKGQRILISGDAGCYDFRKGRLDYYEDLLQPLAPLQVVQIAHHGGHNYDFYNALLAAGFAKQKDSAFLLLSHAKQDAHRPSAAFEQFVARTRRSDNEMSLLFTSEPQVSKVQNYRQLIHPVIPSGNRAKEGDIRLSYQIDDNPGWTVERHSIGV